MPDKKENPINLSQKTRRNLYKKNRRQIERSKREQVCLPEFDRLHGLKHQEFPRLHEFRMGWLCGRSYERENALLSESTLSKEETITLDLDTYRAWVDSVLAASARISKLEDLNRGQVLDLQLLRMALDQKTKLLESANRFIEDTTGVN